MGTCSSGKETRTKRMPISFLSDRRTCSNFLGSLIFPDSIIPVEIFRSPYLPILIPVFAGTSSINFNDSSEISRPKEGAIKNRGVGKNRLYKLRNIPVLYPVVDFCDSFYLCLRVAKIHYRVIPYSYLARAPAGIVSLGTSKEKAPSSVETARIIP